MSLLEQQLAQAKLIAEESDKKYEEVGHLPANKGPLNFFLSEANYQSFVDVYLTFLEKEIQILLDFIQNNYKSLFSLNEH